MNEKDSANNQAQQSSQAMSLPHGEPRPASALSTPGLAPKTLLRERYQIKRVLGGSDYGLTYLGLDLRSQQAVLVREYYPAKLALRHSDGTSVVAYAETEEAFAYGVQRILEESSRLARLADHTHIVSLIDTFEACGTVYRVHRHVKGSSLDTFVQAHGGKIPEAFAVAITKGILAGLRALHNTSIIHGDVRPRSVIIGPEHEVMLTLSSARFAQSNQDAVWEDAELSYIATEQRQAKDVGTWTDIYATGGVLFTMLVGHAPHEHHADRPQGAEHDHHRILENAGVSRRLRAAVRLAMQESIDDRFQTARMFHRALVTPKTNPEQVATEVAAPVAPQRAAASKSSPKALIAGLIALALTIVAIVVVASRDTPQGSTSSEHTTSAERSDSQAANDDHQAKLKIRNDSPQFWTERIRSLRRNLRDAPNAPEVRHALALELAGLEERYPDMFAHIPSYATQLEELLQDEAIANAPAIRTRRALSGAALDEVKAMLPTQISTADEAYLSARHAMREEQYARAIALFDSALALNPGDSALLYDRAVVLEASNDSAEAMRTLRKVVEITPDHIPARIKLAALCTDNDQLGNADKHLSAALNEAKRAARRPLTFRILHARAELARRQGNRASRVDALSRAQRVRPRDVETALLLAEASDAEQAITYLKKAIKGGADSPKIYHRMIALHNKLGHAKNAETLLEEAAKRYPKDVQLGLLAAQLDLESERLESAKAKFAAITQHSPQEPEAWLKLAGLHWRTKNHQVALRTLDRAAEVLTDKLPVLEQRAEYLVTLGESVKAKETMQQIIGLDSNKNQVKLRFALLLRKLKAPAESARYFGELVTAGALSPSDNVAFADVLFQLKRFEEALKRLDQARAAGHQDLEEELIRGAVLVELRRHDDADVVLHNALKRDPRSGKAYHYLGINEMAQKNYRRATDFLSRASELAPANLNIRFALARSLVVQGGPDNRKQALSHYAFLVRSYQSMDANLARREINPEVYADRGEIYFGQGKFKAALADFEKARSLAGDNPERLVASAKALRKTSQPKKAKEYLLKVLGEHAGHAGANFQLGMIFLRGQQRAQAIKHFELSVANEPDRHREAFRHLGYLYSESGARAKGCAAFRGYLKRTEERHADAADVRQMVKQQCR